LKEELYHCLDECRLCASVYLENIVRLAPTPAGNNFLTEKERSENSEPIFPLDVNFCKECFHLQLGHVVDPDHLFKNYHFVSGTSQVNIQHFENYAENIISSLDLDKNSFILDIGSNDGTNLRAFKKRKMRVLGIDPAENVAEIANNIGIETIPDYFSKELAEHIMEKYGTPNLITSHNVLAHVDDFQGVMKSIRSLMNDKSVFIFEVGYFVDVFENLWFDTIYHEHLDYHTVAPLKKFFENIGMELFHVERVDMQGGSIRNFVQLSNGVNDIKNSVEGLIEEESRMGLDNYQVLQNYQRRIDDSKNELLNLLKDIKSSGMTIAGYGAPTKSTTLMNYFELTTDIIDYIIDDNELKQGKFSPLLHIPIVSKDYLLAKPKPDYLLILAWNFAESIIKKVESEAIFEGKYIIPLPTARII
tara:strand:+ start:832 stop:2085 length:1254 start_codon:yes stop_codon:yes gene_type:complete